MKISRRQVEEVEIIAPNSKRKKTLDSLKEKGYTTLTLGPNKKKDGWSWDLKRFRVTASRPVSEWKPTEEL